MGCDGTAMNLPCANKDPMEITREEAVHALELVLGINDLGDADGFDSAEISRERLYENAGSIPAISIERRPR